MREVVPQCSLEHVTQSRRQGHKTCRKFASASVQNSRVPELQAAGLRCSRFGVKESISSYLNNSRANFGLNRSFIGQNIGTGRVWYLFSWYAVPTSSFHLRKMDWYQNGGEVAGPKYKHWTLPARNIRLQ